MQSKIAKIFFETSKEFYSRCMNYLFSLDNSVCCLEKVCPYFLLPIYVIEILSSEFNYNLRPAIAC